MAIAINYESALVVSNMRQCSVDESSQLGLMAGAGLGERLLELAPQIM
jgi:hypothetical protein